MGSLESLFGIFKPKIEDLFGVAKNAAETAASSMEDLFGIGQPNAQSTNQNASNVTTGGMVTTANSTPSIISSGLNRKPESMTFNVDKTQPVIQKNLQIAKTEQAQGIYGKQSKNDAEKQAKIQTRTDELVSKGWEPEKAKMLAGIEHNDVVGNAILGTGATSELKNAVSKLEPFHGLKDLSLKTLEALKGKTVIAKNELIGLLNKPGVKQQEKDLITAAIEKFGNKVNVQELANNIKSELLPLYRRTSGQIDAAGNKFTERYENISLPEELRGNVDTYREHIYDSPIKTSAGQTHFGNSSDRYFGHTRTEDMAQKNWDKTKTFEENQIPDTRRVIEVQSDLFQKGQRELESANENIKIAKNNIELLKKQAVEKNNPTMNDNIIKEQQGIIDKYSKTQKLQQYSNPTAHFRMVREEVKQAAKDGIKKLQFPTGETAMKIEGLAQSPSFKVHNPNISEDTPMRGFENLTTDNMKIGMQVFDRGRVDWIITDVLGDGKFKAVPKNVFDKYGGYKEKLLNESSVRANTEEFDISGKVDTENPIYKFYEKDLGRYLQNKYDAKIITDDKGIRWFQVDIKPEMKNNPVEAFGFSTPKAILSTLGAGAATLAGIKAMKEGNSDYIIQPTKKYGGIYENNGMYKPEINKDLLQSAYDSFIGKKTEENKYPKDTGVKKPVIAERFIEGKKKKVNVNDITELKNIYKVREEKKKFYSGNKKSIGNIDLETKPYATNPNHIKSIKSIYSQVKDFSYQDMQDEFKRLKSPLQYISGDISKALEYYGITPGEFVAVVRQDSNAGTSGKRAIENKNPGNVGNVDNGSNTKFGTWLEGSVAAIRNLAERKI